MSHHALSGRSGSKVVVVHVKIIEVERGPSRELACTPREYRRNVSEAADLHDASVVTYG
jgi:hypothetical protein